MKSILIIGAFSVLAITNSQDSFAGKSFECNEYAASQKVKKSLGIKKDSKRKTITTLEYIPLSPMKKNTSTWRYWEKKNKDEKDNTVFRTDTDDSKPGDFFRLEVTKVQQ